VQEKSGSEANERFEHDFKTLADVLIQETIKHEVGALFPAMQEAILGEESPNFTNKLGESVTIAVGSSEEDTASCLQAVLSGHEGAASALAKEVHQEVNFNSEKLGEIPQLPEELDYANLGIWIDPIGRLLLEHMYMDQFNLISGWDSRNLIGQRYISENYTSTFQNYICIFVYGNACLFIPIFLYRYIHMYVCMYMISLLIITQRNTQN